MGLQPGEAYYCRVSIYSWRKGDGFKRYLTIQLITLMMAFWVSDLAIVDGSVFPTNLPELKINHRLSPAEDLLFKLGNVQRGHLYPHDATERMRLLKLVKSSHHYAVEGFGNNLQMQNPNQSGADSKFTETESVNFREVTAYNVGDPDQNFGDPCQSANGENICVAVDLGLKRCAANFVPFGTKLHIDQYGVCTVTDRMHKKHKHRVDIAMPKHEKEKALQFGVRRLKVIIITSNDF